MNSSDKKKNFFPHTVSRDQAKDTGMAMILICMLLWYFLSFEKLIGLSMVLLIINMTIPNIYKPVAKLWLGFSNLLGEVMSKILLSILFFLLVTPIGIFRTMIGKDALMLKQWKKSNASVFEIRNHPYQTKDIEKPF